MESHILKQPIIKLHKLDDSHFKELATVRKKPRPYEQLRLSKRQPVVRLHRLDLPYPSMEYRHLRHKASGLPHKKQKLNNKMEYKKNGYILPRLSKEELQKHLRLLKIFEEEDSDEIENDDNDVEFFDDKRRSSRLKKQSTSALPPKDLSSKSSNNEERISNCHKSHLHYLWPEAAIKSFNGQDPNCFGFRQTRRTYSIYAADKLKEDQDASKKSHEGLKDSFKPNDLNPLGSDEVFYPSLGSRASNKDLRSFSFPPHFEKSLRRLRWIRYMSAEAVAELMQNIQDNYHFKKETKDNESLKKVKKGISEKVRNGLLREEFKKHHHLMRIFEEIEDEMPNQTECQSQPDPTKKNEKEETHPNKVFVANFINKMKEASWNDRFVSSTPNHFKVGMLTRVLLTLQDPANCHMFGNQRGLEVIADWLSILPRNRLPHLAVREMMLSILLTKFSSIPESLVQQSRLVETLEALLQHPHEQPLHKHWIVHLLQRWSPKSPLLNFDIQHWLNLPTTSEDEEDVPVTKNGLSSPSSNDGSGRPRSSRVRNVKLIEDSHIPRWYLHLVCKEGKKRPLEASLDSSHARKKK